MRFWAGPQVLIVDELGYLPMVGEAGSHLFQVISRRYLHGTVILTTNRGIAEWGAIFEDTTVAVAILDRLLHYATVVADRRRQLPHARPPREARSAPLSSQRSTLTRAEPLRRHATCHPTNSHDNRNSPLHEQRAPRQRRRVVHPNAQRPDPERPGT